MVVVGFYIFNENFFFEFFEIFVDKVFEDWLDVFIFVSIVLWCDVMEFVNCYWWLFCSWDYLLICNILLLNFVLWLKCCRKFFVSRFLVVFKRLLFRVCLLLLFLYWVCEMLYYIIWFFFNLCWRRNILCCLRCVLCFIFMN